MKLREFVYNRQILPLIFFVFIMGGVFAATDELVQGVKMAKYFYLCTIVCVGLPVLSFFSVINKQQLQISFNIIDILLIVFLLYSFVRLLTTPYISVYNTKFTVLLLSTVLYFLFKNFISNALQKHKTKEVTILFIIVLVIAFLQALYGNLQLHGFFKSNHNLFKVTGSFFNPGPYSGYLASVFPFALGCYLFTADKGTLNNTLRYIAIATMVVTALILPVTQSRAAWLAVIVGAVFILFTRFNLFQKIKNYLNKWYKKTIAILIVSTILIGSGIFLFQFKKDSASGRLLIWKLSTKMIAEKPIFGTGYDRFTVNYNNHQAAYFAEQHNNNSLNEQEAMVAGIGEYGFNEYLQTAVEIGIFGLIILLGILFFAGRYVITNYQLRITEGGRHYGYVAFAGVLSILIFALFSYPFSVPFIFINLFFFLAIISAEYSTKSDKYNIEFGVTANKLLRFSCFVLAVGLSIIGIPKINTQIVAFEEWKDAQICLYSGLYEDAAEIYFHNLKELKPKPLFMHQYGKALVLAGKNQEGIEVLEEAKNSCADPYLYNSLGDAYKAIKQYHKAEQSYIYASNIIPHKFYPKYLLANLYKATNNNKKAVDMANKILKMKVKKQSPAIEEIKQDMNILIELDTKEQ